MQSHLFENLHITAKLSVLMFVLSGLALGDEYRWSGGGDGKSLYDAKNWEHTESGNTLPQFTKNKELDHRLLLTSGVIGGSWGFEPTLLLGKGGFVQKGGEIKGKAGKDGRQRSGIAADAEGGGSRISVALSGGRAKLGFFRDANVTLSGDANLVLANKWKVLPDSILDIDVNYKGELRIENRRIDWFDKTDLRCMTVGGQPAQLGVNLEREIKSPKYFLLSVIPGGVLSKTSTGTDAPIETGRRVWTDLDGRTLEGQLEKLDGELALVRMGEERLVKIPLKRLTQEDRTYIDQWRRTQAGRMASHKEKTPEPTGATSPKELVPEKIVVGEFPNSVGPPESFEAKILKEDAGENVYEYASPHFRYISDRRLTSRLVTQFAILYEATYLAVQGMPWGVTLDPGEEDDRYPVYLFTDKEEYYRNGGVPGSAGVSIGTKSFALISSLGVKDTGKRLILEDIEDNTVLVHELTHSLRSIVDRNLPVWCVEGAADYLASAPYRRGGTFSYRSRLKDVVDYVKNRRGFSEGELTVPFSLKRLFKMDHQAFYNGGDEVGISKDAGANYALAVLVYSWLWHEDRGKTGEKQAGEPIVAWRQSLIKGRSESDALQLLLDGRTFEELEEQISKFYRRDIEISFGK